MSDVTQEVMLEQVRRIRADIADLKEFMVSLGVRTAGTDHVMAGQHRPERIEKRLDLE